MSDSFLFQAFVYLLAAVIAVPIAKRLGLGSVLGYLLAGVAIGPSALNLAGGAKDVMHFAEFGVVMMLFLIGLELRPALLWRMRGPILGMGGLQMLGTSLAVLVIALLAGRPWREALAVGLIVAMSSTAIILQSLAEKNLLKTRGGQSCFSVLLFQDIAVIPLLALLPLLAMNGGSAPGAEHLTKPLAHLPHWAQALATFGAVAIIIIGGRWLLRPVFRFIAGTRLREAFTAATLLLVIGIALLMEFVGLSAALGTFLAGVVLSDSEYRHEIETDLEPFKGLLLGLFFLSVGSGIDFALVRAHPGLIALLVAGLVLVKFAVLVPVARIFRSDWGESLLFALAMAQGGEFCFVLFTFSEAHGVLGPAVTKPLTAAVALSMALAPLLFLLYEKVVAPRVARKKNTREPDEIEDHDHPVILAGFGRFGHVIGRLLRANGFGVTVLDNDAEQVELLGKFGMQSFYGDASRLDLLRAAGAAKARLFVLAIDDEERSLGIVRTVQHEFPKLRILARAVSRQHAYELFRLGVDDVYRETLGSAVELGVTALRALGMRGVDALRATRIFKQHDEAAVRDMADLQQIDGAYVTRARQHIENLERILRSDRFEAKDPTGNQWSPDSRKDGE
ncbi:MAG: monovalent cation:proton antiporter-2 (CPA2) family protein [Chthoniobacteraceae bacterium]